jgi:hypothetical protein
MRTAIASVLAMAALSGCFYQNMSPATKLRDAVEANNEGARWGRMDIARERVSPAYMGEFIRRRYDWGQGIQMADVDILSIQMNDETEHAQVVVAFGWYSYDDMSLARTVVRQKWDSSGSGYVLMDEEVIDGDERLLEPPPEPEEDDEADSEEEVVEEDMRTPSDQAEPVRDDDWIDADDEEIAEPDTIARSI